MPKRKTPSRFCLLCEGNVPCEIVYHKFPSNPQIRESWMNACQLDKENDDVSNTYLCSQHFKPDDYIDINAKKLGGCLRLKPGIIPSVLLPSKPDDHKRGCTHLSSSLQEATSAHSTVPCFETTVDVPLLACRPTTPATTYGVSHSSLGLVSQEMSVQCNVVPQMVTPHRRKRSSPDVSTPRRAKRRLNYALEVISREKKKIKNLNQKNRRLIKRVKSLKDLVNHLRKNAMISEEANLLLVT
ncbi:uncharacterized protein LOC108916116 [Anoplophora glabripennis]|uniref:uncharacterized protein LOC108916116 n=1 Tax=Anoplophora glabripennis TaxID=217634 RepID=UPI000C7913B1|nr:uncharacterized protein LOC108916116 [Anoplophora glabripennis]XP_023312363.1 uncharacterized protein LOC108916116 [Anoplophora glabripennis]